MFIRHPYPTIPYSTTTRIHCLYTHPALNRTLQTPVHVEEVKALYKTRIERALFRAQGLELLTELLAQTPALPMQVDLLVGFMRALRKVREGGAPKSGLLRGGGMTMN